MESESKKLFAQTDQKLSLTRWLLRWDARHQALHAALRANQIDLLLNIPVPTEAPIRQVVYMHADASQTDCSTTNK